MQINQCDAPYQQRETQSPHYHLNRFKKALDKIQHSFTIKSLIKVGIEEAYLNIIKALRTNPSLLNYSTVKS